MFCLQDAGFSYIPTKSVNSFVLRDNKLNGLTMKILKTGHSSSFTHS